MGQVFRSKVLANAVIAALLFSAPSPFGAGAQLPTEKRSFLPADFAAGELQSIEAFGMSHDSCCLSNRLGIELTIRQVRKEKRQ